MKNKLIRFINRYQCRIEIEAHKESKETGRTTHKILSMALAVSNLKYFAACAFGVIGWGLFLWGIL